MGETLDFGEALARKREGKRLTRLQVGHRAQMDDSTIGHYERGSRRVSPETAVVLAEAIGDQGLLYTFCRGCPVARAISKNPGGAA